MSGKENNHKAQVTPEQLKQLMALQQGLAQQKPLTRKQQLIQNFFQGSQLVLHQLDRFVNFITKKQDNERNDVVQAARSPILFGVYVIIIFIGFGGLWSVIAPLNSAVVAIGTVVSSTNKKIIQHQEGGIVKNIFVKQGDHVKAGDKLIELEDARIKSQYENALNQYRVALATEGRLIAERDKLENIEFADFLKQSADIPEVSKVIHTQENLFRHRNEAYRAEKESLKQKIAQLYKQIEAYEARMVAVSKNLMIESDRLKAQRTLMNKGFASKATVLEREAREASLKSELANTQTEIAKTKQEITRSEIEGINYENKYLSEILRELKEIQLQVATYKEQLGALTDAMQRIIIKSPVDGIINSMNIHTIGGVVGSGGTLLEISPTNDALIVEAKVPHKNIDSVHVGMISKIRFSAFKSRITPSFTGKVVSVSPDIVQDRSNQNPMMGGEAFYIARIEIDMDEFNRIAKAKKLELHPGMQAEVQVITGTRTLLRYLLDPVTDTMFRAFREK